MKSKKSSEVRGVGGLTRAPPATAPRGQLSEMGFQAKARTGAVRRENRRHLPFASSEGICELPTPS